MLVTYVDSLKKDNEIPSTRAPIALEIGMDILRQSATIAKLEAAKKFAWQRCMSCFATNNYQSDQNL